MEPIFESAVREWFSYAIKQIQSDLRTKFQKDITSTLTDWEFIQDKGKDIIKPATLTVMSNGGEQSYNLLQAKGSFDVLNVVSVRAAEKFTADLVRQVTNETKKGIRTFISAGVKEGKSMDKIAREVRPLVGLTKNQTQSVMNFRTRLQDKDKFPKLTDTDIDRKTQKYADKTHRRRAKTIARTETARAQNMGYAVGMEDLGVEQVEFSAILDDRTSTICLNLNGKKFTPAESVGIIPAHVNCRSGFIPVIAGESVGTPKQAASAVPKHIDGLLKKLEKTTDIAISRKLKGSLRKLGHKGELKVVKPTPPIARPALVPKPTETLSSRSFNALRESDDIATKTYKPSKLGIDAYEKIIHLDTKEAIDLLKYRGKTKIEVYKDIIKFRKLQSQTPPTINTYFSGKVTKKVLHKRLQLHQNIADDMLATVKPAKGTPKFIMTGGYPGSGKSSMLNTAFPGWKKKYLHIDSDDIKLKLAKADGHKALGWRSASYQQESDYIINELFDRARASKMNIMFDGTMKSQKKALKIVDAYKKYGYEVEAAFADLPLEKSMLRSISRMYGQQNRFVEPMYQATHGTKNIDTFNRLKGKVNKWVHYNTDVPRGKKPIKVATGGSKI